MDSSRSPLEQLMISCPNVEEVYLSEAAAASYDYTTCWEYFFEALEKANTWHLCKITKPWDFSFNWEYYYRFANIMRQILSHIYVEKSANRGSFKYLQDYANLTSIEIKYTTPTSVIDFLQVLQHTTHLEKVKVSTT